MRSLEEFLNSSLIEVLYQSREDEFQSIIAKKNQSTKDEERDIEQELLDLLSKYIPDELNRRKVHQKLDELENEIFSDNERLNRSFYKLGFIDGRNINKEII